MKERTSVMFVAWGAMLIVTGSVVFAQLRSGYYGAISTGSIGQTAEPEAAPDSNYEVPSFASFVPELAEGEGLLEVKRSCVTCHSQTYITMQPPLSAATWEAEVNKMITTYGAPIPDAAAKKIVSYLQERYTPENRKR
jgi:hypothetical protein